MIQRFLFTVAGAFALGCYLGFQISAAKYRQPQLGRYALSATHDAVMIMDTADSSLYVLDKKAWIKIPGNPVESAESKELEKFLNAGSK